jgi:hypothetical protein
MANEEKQKGENFSEVLQSLGIGLSRLLRYSYPGFLLIVFASIVASDKAKLIRDAMSWELLSLTTVVVGAGLYAVHRSVVVPLHHGLLCLLWWAVDSARGINESQSASPTRWLKSIDIGFVWRITAYTMLRRSDLFENEKTSWNVAHAESGLVLMTVEAFFAAGIYAYWTQSQQSDWRYLVWSGGVLLVFSFAGFIQHAVECQRFKKDKEKVKKYLIDIGLLS